MKRLAVKSSNIKSIGYSELGMVLEVEFNNGSIYHYSSCTNALYAQLQSAESIGKFFNQVIKAICPCLKGEFVTKPKSVYFVGKAGSGKTTAAEFFRIKRNFRTAKFAFPVYNLARDYFFMTGKDRKLLQLIGTDIGRKYIDTNIWVRRFFEDTEIVSRTYKELHGKELQFVLDDCRFENEHKALKDAGWLGFYLDVDADTRLERLRLRDDTAQKETLGHSSEVAMDAFKEDLIKIDASKSEAEVNSEIISHLGALNG